jgi:hypothetical protein
MLDGAKQAYGIIATIKKYSMGSRRQLTCWKMASELSGLSLTRRWAGADAR